MGMPCRHHDGITSAILVGAHLLRHAPAACQEELWQSFVAAAWPWTMWHHHAIRSVAHLLPLLQTSLAQSYELSHFVSMDPHCAVTACVHCLWQAIVPKP